MDWTGIADGGWPANDAFSVLSDAGRLEELKQALRWAMDHQLSRPQGSKRVAIAALHLMDAYEMAYPVHRAWLSCVIGTCAVHLGDMDGANAILRRLIDAPAPGTESVRLVAMNAYADAIRNSDPDQAITLLRELIRSAPSAESAAAAGPPVTVKSLAASAAVSLGALLRWRGQVNEARQAFEEGINSCPADDPLLSPILARLHGNLGNLFFDQLRDYPKAADHYAMSIAAFDAAGEDRNAAQRYLHLVDARLMSGRYADALNLLREGDRRVAGDLEMFRDELLEPAHWQQVDDPADWEAYFATLLERHSDALTPPAKAALVVATILLRKRMGDDVTAIRLAHDARLASLTESPLTGALATEVVQLAEEHACRGILWPLIACSEEMTFGLADNELQSLKFDFASEAAAIWLLDMARRATCPGWNDAEFLACVSSPATVPGIAAVPAQPPALLGPVEPAVRAEFARLRALLPTASEAGEEATALISASYGQGRIIPGSEDRLRRATYLADLLGDPVLQATARRAFVQCVERSGLPPRERYEASTAILAEAESLAWGVPVEQMWIHLIFATVLKESVVVDESARLTAATGHARRALAIAARRGYDEMVAACSLTLGNALMEYDGASADELREAAQVLESGLAAFQANPSSQRAEESQFYNSLGIANHKLGNEERSPGRYQVGLDYLEKALDLRDRHGDADGALRTLTNMVGMLMDYRRLTGQLPQHELRALADRALQLTPRVSRAETRCAAFANLCVAYRETDMAVARDVARQAVAAARDVGRSPLAAECLLNASAVFSRAHDIDQARELLAEATTMVEDFRLEAGATRYRAELTERFNAAYLELERALEKSGAPETDRWWAIERNTGRTILEGIRHRTRTADQASVLAALSHLPADTVVLHTYVDGDNMLGYFHLRSDGGRVRVRKGQHSVPMRELTLGMGGTVTEHGGTMRAYTPAQAEAYARQLSWIGTHFLAPVLAELDFAGVARIVVTSQALTYLPWHAVPVPPYGVPLGATWEVIFVPSVTVLGGFLAEPRPQLVKAAFVACDPSGTLRQHISECRHAFSALHTADKIVLTDTSRTVSRRDVHELLEEVDLFHFSGHSTLVSGAPHESGLLLSDGLMTLPELEQALSRRSPALLFLSSCESGAVDLTMRDAATLSSVFLQAGARAVIGASWPVPDYIAAKTAQVFYEELSTHDAVAALKTAHAQLLADPIAGDDWAAFRFQGWL